MADIIERVTNADVSTVFSSQILDYVVLGLELAVILGALLFLIFVVMNYKHKINIMKMTPNGYKMITKRCMRKKEKGTNEFRYKIFMSKKFVPITDNPNQFYIEDLKGNFTPTSVENYKDSLKMKPASLDFWLANQIQESNAIYKAEESFWERNKSIIVSFVLITFAFVCIILILEQMAEITTGLNAVADAFSKGKVVLSVPAGKW